MPASLRCESHGAELDPSHPTSHVARTDQEEFGKIFRRNIAYGTLTRHGTIFVGFSRDQAILQKMLESMVGIGGGPADRLTTVARAVTGAYYVVPSADRLATASGEAQSEPGGGNHSRNVARGARRCSDRRGPAVATYWLAEARRPISSAVHSRRRAMCSAK